MHPILEAGSLTLIVALALTPQILPPDQEVPMTDSDFQLDGVLSPEGMTWRADVDEDKKIA